MFKKSKLIIKKKDNHLAILKKKKINNKMNNIYKNKQKNETYSSITFFKTISISPYNSHMRCLMHCPQFVGCIGLKRGLSAKQRL